MASRMVQLSERTVSCCSQTIFRTIVICNEYYHPRFICLVGLSFRLNPSREIACPMARLPRYGVPGQPQHVIQRGNSREVILCADADYRFYLDTNSR